MAREAGDFILERTGVYGKLASGWPPTLGTMVTEGGVEEGPIEPAMEVGTRLTRYPVGH